MIIIADGKSISNQDHLKIKDNQDARQRQQSEIHFKLSDKDVKNDM